MPSNRVIDWKFETYGKTLAHGADRLISSQDSLALGDDGAGNAGKLLLEFLRWVVEIGSHFELRFEVLTVTEQLKKKNIKIISIFNLYLFLKGCTTVRNHYSELPLKESTNEKLVYEKVYIKRHSRKLGSNSRQNIPLKNPRHFVLFSKRFLVSQKACEFSTLPLSGR